MFLCCDKIDYDCEIIRITKNETVLSVGSYTPVTTEPELDVTLFPAILKGDKMEYVVQKCTELGVNAIIPFVSANCECRPSAVRVDRLKKIAEEDIEDARHKLANTLCNYQGFKKCEIILVFDAYRVKGNVGEISKYHNITIVYTKEAETADMYIEKVTHEIGRKYRVRVATSEGLEQIIILGHGALRLSASAFLEEVQEVEKAIREYLQ